LPRQEIINGVRVKRFPSWAPSESYYFSPELRRHLVNCSRQYDVVHAHSYHALPALYAAQCKRTNKLFFSPHYHGGGHSFLRNLLHIPYKLLGKSIFRKAEKVICVSNYEKSLVLSRFKVDPHKVEVIPNGVDLGESAPPKKERGRCRTLLCVGRLEKYKGVQYLIEALPRIGRDIVLEIIGSGPYSKNLLRLCRKLGVEDRVRFRRALTRRDLLQEYANADLFVLLSRREAYGISVAEALASATPCIVANGSALKEWIDGENCFGIGYPIDLDELARLITNVIGRRARSLKLTDWDEVASRLGQLYESCVCFPAMPEVCGSR